MVDVLAQIESLMRHACENQNLDEARNAGLAIARLIKKYNITLVLPPQSNGTSFPPPRPARPPRPPPSSVRAEEDRIARAREQARKAEAKKQAETKKKAEDDGWRPMKAKFAGYCKWCGKEIKPNTPIYWSRDHGAYHPVCYLQSG